MPPLCGLYVTLRGPSICRLACLSSGAPFAVVLRRPFAARGPVAVFIHGKAATDWLAVNACSPTPVSHDLFRQFNTAARFRTLCTPLRPFAAFRCPSRPFAGGPFPALSVALSRLRPALRCPNLRPLCSSQPFAVLRLFSTSCGPLTAPLWLSAFCAPSRPIAALV
jgi:hypothetical protein